LTTHLERLLLVLAPAVAIAAIGVGLEAGGHGKRDAAVVYAAPPARAATGLAWQVVTFQEDRGAREPVALSGVTVKGSWNGQMTSWEGATNADGVAEVFLPLPAADVVDLEVRADGAVLARGAAKVPAATESVKAAPWSPFARREGPILLDVAVLGDRVAPGFAADVGVRARDAISGAPMVGAVVEVEADPSITSSGSPQKTDSRGWAEMVVVPAGLAVSLSLRAKGATGRTGAWTGGLFVSPGASQVRTKAVWSPQQEPEIEVTAPTPRSTAYVEVDDSRGRAWASTLELSSADRGATHGVARAPRLPPGLYWAVTSSDPAGAARLGPGTAVRPFFVAETDEEALAFGFDRDACAPNHDPREVSRAIWACLALAPSSPVPRKAVLEGFSMLHARDGEKRARGLMVGLGALAIAVVLEAVLLLRAAASRATIALPWDEQDHVGAAPGSSALRSNAWGRSWSVAVAVLVALLGFALLGAFLVRLG
jgi:hypothetical protein